MILAVVTVVLVVLIRSSVWLRVEFDQIRSCLDENLMCIIGPVYKHCKLDQCKFIYDPKTNSHTVTFQNEEIQQGIRLAKWCCKRYQTMLIICSVTRL